MTSKPTRDFLGSNPFPVGGSRKWPKTDLNPALDAAERLTPERGQHHHVASELEVVLAVGGRRVAFGADVAVENHLVDVDVEPEVW